MSAKMVIGCVETHREQNGFVWTWTCGELWHQSARWGFRELARTPVHIVGNRQGEWPKKFPLLLLCVHLYRCGSSTSVSVWVFWVGWLYFIVFKTFTIALVQLQCTVTYMHNYIMYNYTKGSTFKSIQLIYHLTSVMNLMPIPFINISSVNIFSYVF